MRLVAFADTHTQHTQLIVPDGDVLIFPGDMCSSGSIQQFYSFSNWLSTLSHPTKIVIAGNHDRCIEENYVICRNILREAGAMYLADQSTILPNGMQLYGSPWTPPFMNWWFMADAQRRAVTWAAIPDTTEILVTHGPPLGILDYVPDDEENAGDALLLERIQQLPRLQYHFFGHIHEGYGQVAFGSMKMYNVAVLDGDYKLVNNPVIVDI